MDAHTTESELPRWTRPKLPVPNVRFIIKSAKQYVPFGRVTRNWARIKGVSGSALLVPSVISLADVRCVDTDPRFSNMGDRVDSLSDDTERLISWLCKSETDLLWPMCSLSAIRLIMLML